MSVDSVNQAASAIYAASQTNKQPSAEKTAQSSQTGQRTVEDTVSLSPEGIKVLDMSEYYVDIKDQPPEVQEYISRVLQKQEHMQLKVQYNDEANQFRKERRSEVRATRDSLLREAGGLLNGVAYSGDLSRITTTSGHTHPNADQIRSFLQGHSAEREEMKALQNSKFMSFEEWKANRLER